MTRCAVWGSSQVKLSSMTCEPTPCVTLNFLASFLARRSSGDWSSLSPSITVTLRTPSITVNKAPLTLALSTCFQPWGGGMRESSSMYSRATCMTTGCPVSIFSSSMMGSRWVAYGV